jgi:hypothetical protein
MTLGDFLNKLALQVGMTADDKGLVSILSNAAIATANISDEFATKLQSGLLTVEAAKAHPEIKSHNTALALNALDSELNTLMTEYEIPDEKKTELLAEKSSYKRVALFTRMVKELEGKKSNTSKVDKDKLAIDIENLNIELRNLKVNSDKEKSDLINAHKVERINWELNNHYSGYEYANDKLSKEANIRLSQILVSDELAKNGLKIENIDGALKLTTKEGTDYFQNNAKVSVSDFLSKTLTTNGVINIAGKEKQKIQQQNSNQNQNKQNQNLGKKTSYELSIEKTLSEAMNNSVEE